MAKYCTVRACLQGEFRFNLRRTGRQRYNTLYLYVHDGHYDLTTSMSGFYDKSYFCEQFFFLQATA